MAANFHGGRRSSSRLREKNSFSRFINTPDNPLCIDMDEDEGVQNTGTILPKKVKRGNQHAGPRSLNQIMQENVNGIPARLGYFVVDHFNPDTMQLNFGGHVIQIMEQLVSESLGLRNEGIDLETAEPDNRSTVLFRAWRKQYQGRKVTPTDLKEDIKAKRLSDDIFLINFMLLFASLMGECSPQGCCYRSILTKFTSIKMLHNINWPRYIFECLRRSKRSWRPNTSECFYSGPLTLLTLVYVSKIQPVGVKVDLNGTPIHVWNKKMLRTLQDALIRNGGFAHAQLRQFEGVPSCPQQPSDRVPQTSFPKSSTTIKCLETNVNTSMPTSDANTQPSSENTIGPDVLQNRENGQSSRWNEPPQTQNDSDEYEYDSDDFDEVKKEYMSLIEEKFAIIHEARWDLEELLSEAADFFPDDKVFRAYNATRKSIFRDCPSDDSDSDGSDEETEEEDQQPANVARETPDVTPTKNVIPTDLTSLNLSPLSPIWLSQTTFDILDESLKTTSVGRDITDQREEGTTSNQVQPHESIPSDIVLYQNNSANEDLDVRPSYNIGFSPIRRCPLPTPSLDGNHNAFHGTDVRREIRRGQKVGMHLRSPFVRRTVLIGTRVKPMETKVHALCLAANGGPESSTGQCITRAPMESLAAHEHIFVGAIDGWVDVLNFEERRRSPTSPMRYFFKPCVLTGGVLMHNMYSFPDRFELFHTNMMNSANENVDIVNMCAIDMVFFPILHGFHYFCVVFNFKTTMIDILDNIHWVANMDEIYESEINELRSLFVHHLKSINHPSAESFASVEPRLVEMKWRTKSNYVDCGVFLMRHMETYMGGGARGWFVGLPTEAEGHKKALEILRIKYTWKLLLGEYNQFKDDIKREIDKFYEDGDEAVNRSLQDAANTRENRLNRF
ncbi:hypothetical protein OSB04_001564 [Centaurea solstitialis]|uniref:Ubiquitin-like protease family profile domain-containing protein n=1 Tax=Centaurea solstitialis TaxID=347529 RepID=A0AA38UA47_9ASTR|nr:hypothetical protein OSB04_001564 [Centaurea solstitialis]